MANDLQHKTEYELRRHFYKARMAAYRKRRPAGLPCRATLRRWTREVNEQLHQHLEDAALAARAKALGMNTSFNPDMASRYLSEG